MAEPSHLPSGTVTFLFTDIEGSTRLWQEHPEAMPAVYAGHDAVLREAAATHGGVVYKIVGDAFQIAFSAAPEAVAAAGAAQVALYATTWPTPEPVRVRMALHTGAVDPDAGGDYRSPVLNRLGRLLGAAHGGQTLVSAATHELVRDTLPAETALRDLGEQRLKDLYRPERVFQLLPPGLAADFPPLRTLERRPNNLPVQLTPFVGREQEVAAAQARLLDGDTHLLTLTGPGGTGKTRLALQVAADVLDAFADGVFLVELAVLTDAALVLPTIAQTVGVTEEPGRSLGDTLKAHLAERETLLVLDNFEQVVEAAPDVIEVLAGCPRLKMLVTSRTRLGVRGEREFPVPPLRLPDPRRLPPLALLSQFEAVRLFIERAHAVRPDFAVTNENAPAVAEICHRLDGLPLAIELAAARIRLLSPAAMLARLEQRLTLLTGGARDLPERQRTLRGAIAWSYDLLSPAEQTLFRRLAVFAGGCGIDAAEAVSNPGDLDVDTLDGLASLVDKSLLRPGEQGGEPRFSMLETVREYASEQLATSGELDVAQGRHVAFFLALAERAEPHLTGPDQVDWLDRLDAEQDNMRAALAWAAARDAETALRLGAALNHFWWFRGNLEEGGRWLERALTGHGATGVSPAVRAKALSAAGILAESQSDLAGAAQLLDESIGLRRRLGDSGGTAGDLFMLGLIAERQGAPARARALREEALALYEQRGDARGIVVTMLSLGTGMLNRGELAAAATTIGEALPRAREVGDRDLLAGILFGLAHIAGLQGDYAQAAALDDEALALQRELGSTLNIAAIRIHQVQLQLAGGDSASADQAIQEALALAHDAGDSGTVAHARAVSGVLTARGGDADRGAAEVDDAIARFRALGDRANEGLALSYLGDVRRQQEDVPAAAVAYREALPLIHEAADALYEHLPITGLGHVALYFGQHERAARLLGAAAARREAIGMAMPPADRPEHERAVARLQTALGEAGFTAAWAAGQALSIDEAVAEALAIEGPSDG